MSRNDIFAAKWPSPAPSPSPAPPPSVLPATSPKTPLSAHISLKFTPLQPYFLGEGKHCQAYLAAYHSDDPRWVLCAAKRIHLDHEAELALYNEAFLLSKLKSPHILAFIGIKQDLPSKPTLPFQHLAHSRSKSVATRPNHISLPPPSLSLSRNPSQSTPNTPNSAAEEYFDLPSPTTESLRRATSLKITKEPHVPLPRSVKPTQGRLILLTEYCPNGTLLNFVRNTPELIGATLWTRWTTQLISAIHACHSRNILHTDIKPHNIFLDADYNVKLADFGAAILDPISIESLGFGTPFYSPPDLYLSLSSDIYSLGLTIWTLILALEPYETLSTTIEKRIASQHGYWKWVDRLSFGRGRSGTVSSRSSRASSRFREFVDLDTPTTARLSFTEPEIEVSGPTITKEVVAGLLEFPVESLPPQSDPKSLESLITPSKTKAKPGEWKYQSGEVVNPAMVELIREMTLKDATKRPTIDQVQERFRHCC